MTAHAYLFWRVQAAVSPMTEGSDDTDVKWSIQKAAQNNTVVTTSNQISWWNKTTTHFWKHAN